MHNTPGRADTNDRTSHRLFSRRAKPFSFFPFLPPSFPFNEKGRKNPPQVQREKNRKKEKKRKLGLLDILCVLPFSYS
jgi:hypothetical protein